MCTMLLKNMTYIFLFFSRDLVKLEFEKSLGYCSNLILKTIQPYFKNVVVITISIII